LIAICMLGEQRSTIYRQCEVGHGGRELTPGQCESTATDLLLLCCVWRQRRRQRNSNLTPLCLQCLGRRCTSVVVSCSSDSDTVRGDEYLTSLNGKCIFDLYNPANRDLTKANTVLLIRFGSGRSKLMKILDRIRSIYGRTVRSLQLVVSKQMTA